MSACVDPIADAWSPEEPPPVDFNDLQDRTPPLPAFACTLVDRDGDPVAAPFGAQPAIGLSIRKCDCFPICMADAYMRAYVARVPGRDDDVDHFLKLLDEYLDPPHDPNPAMDAVRIVWVEDDPRLGALHIAEHGVSKDEVQQVLMETPPLVEAKRSPCTS